MTLSVTGRNNNNNTGHTAMIVSKRQTLLSALALGASLMTLGSIGNTADARSWGHSSPTTYVYFTRHAEKKTTTETIAIDGLSATLREVCGVEKCAEELSDLGHLRAEYLADWFARWGITDRLTHAFASHKTRTRQTITPIVADAGLAGDQDLIADGIQQLPADGTELMPEGTGVSEDLTVDALLALPTGSTALVAGHSGTLYDIFEKLGIDTSSDYHFPRNSKGKVRDFGDIWKVAIRDGHARLVYRINLQPGPLRLKR